MRKNLLFLPEEESVLRWSQGEMKEMHVTGKFHRQSYWFQLSPFSRERSEPLRNALSQWSLFALKAELAWPKARLASSASRARS